MVSKSEKSSAISGFYKLTQEERRARVAAFADLDERSLTPLLNGGIGLKDAERMIENVIGTFALPFGVAMNFRINDRDYIIPMVIEEPSVVAAASNAARIARVKGGFRATTSAPIMIGQIQIVDLAAPHHAAIALLRHREELLELASEQDPMLVKFGGGARDIEPRIVETATGTQLVLHLHVDVRDAMGANAVNTMCEALAPRVEQLTGGRVRLRILSNLADRRIARATALFDRDTLGGGSVVAGIVEAYAFADADLYRCATHNKGVMNGVTAVVRATGNDTRAVEAGAHAYAARHGCYRSLTTWERDDAGDLVGTIELPVAVGTSGGATKAHPTARTALSILGVKTASELGEVLAAVGLAQNLAALRALATEGIQQGHMALHARNIAVSAGATGALVDRIAEQLVEEGAIRLDRAQKLVREATGGTEDHTAPAR